MLVEAKGDLEGQYYMVDERDLNDKVLKYLQAFVEESDSLINEQEVDETSDEILKLKNLIADLRQDRMQLKQEIDAFR